MTDNVPATSGGAELIMIRPHLAGIPVAAFPEGFGIRPMAPDEAWLWTDIQRDAEPYLKITDAMFTSEFGADPEAIRKRCYIMTDRGGHGIGTISAWFNPDFRGQDFGRIHWVAVRHAFQRMGVAKAALSYALHRLALWHRRAYLVTSTKRVNAVRLYLNYGFEPDAGSADARALWQNMNGQLKHPAIDRALAAG